jgi:hypothetical protein
MMDWFLSAVVYVYRHCPAYPLKLNPLHGNFGNCGTTFVAYRETRVTRTALSHQIAYGFFRDLSQLLWRTTKAAAGERSPNLNPNRRNRSTTA